MQQVARLRALIMKIYLYLPPKLYKDRFVTLLKLANSQFSHRRAALSNELQNLLDECDDELSDISPQSVNIFDDMIYQPTNDEAGLIFHHFFFVCVFFRFIFFVGSFVFGLVSFFFLSYFFWFGLVWFWVGFWCLFSKVSLGEICRDFAKKRKLNTSQKFFFFALFCCVFFDCFYNKPAYVCMYVFETNTHSCLCCNSQQIKQH